MNTVLKIKLDWLKPKGCKSTVRVSDSENYRMNISAALPLDMDGLYKNYIEKNTCFELLVTTYKKRLTAEIKNKAGDFLDKNGVFTLDPDRLATELGKVQSNFYISNSNVKRERLKKYVKRLSSDEVDILEKILTERKEEK